jgi:hypothetical protein
MARGEWSKEVEVLAEALSDADTATFPALARRLHHALMSAPSEVAVALGVPCDANRVESLLACGAYREAAIELLGKANYMLSRGVSHFAIASVASDLFPESSIGSDHESTAVAAALASGLRDWAHAVSRLQSEAAG